MASKKKAEEPKTSPAPRTRSARKPAARNKSEAAKAGGAKSGAGGASVPEAIAAPTGRVVVEREIGGRTLTLETGRMAKLSDGACVARYGDTVVLATVNSAKAPDGIDFFPLTVDYREKTSAAGVIPGGFFKREGRPTTKEILASRLIDRSIRPMFPDGFKREVQVLSQVLATDRENDPDVITAIACFAALALSSLPHGRSLGMVRIGLVDDQLTVNPLWSVLQSDANRLNLTVAGHDEAIMMVEAGAEEVSEATMIAALELAHGVVRTICGMIDELVAKAGKPKMAYDPPKRDPALIEAIEEQFGKELRAAPLTPGPKQARSAASKAAKERACAAFHAPSVASEAEKKAWNTNIAEIVGEIVKDGERQSILRGVRADGRDHKTVRPITIEVGVLPRVHGSVLFTRGETQALGVVTLGGTDDQQIIDGLMPEPRKRFLLHYSFPPFSVGEVKRVLAPGRREIGHGALAERGLEPVLPAKEEFPYTIRITSEILESNGSSSMATACAGTLAMMDAGVPIKAPVAGIAMGLVMEGKKYAILTDILGSEDACGDMDFKVVGTERGITALQMDIKCEGLTRAIMAEALEQARQGRLHVLREMQKALRAPRAELSPNAPRLESLQVPNEKIGLIIGPGGKNIRAMQEQFECKISIEDGGLCTVTGINAEKVKACVEHLKAMTAEVELGGVYEGRVTAIKEFGAFVEILPGQEGLVHVSELSDSFIRAVTDVVRIGDTLKVKVIAIDDFGKVKLSRKALLAAERGEGGAAAGAAPAARPAASDREPRVAREERPLREERREDRPEREGRFDRGLRGPRFEDRGPREDRPDRGPREDRAERGPREDRSERAPREDRPERGPREGRGLREDRPEPAPREERMERGPRPERLDRPERGDRPERHEPRPEGLERRDSAPERSFRSDRERPMPERPMRPMREDGPRRERPAEGVDRGERFERPARGGRDEAPAARGPVREERPARGVEAPRDERRERPMRDESLAPRADRPERGERPERREPREPFGSRAERAAAGDRGGWAARPAEERSQRQPAAPRPERDEHGPRGHRDAAMPRGREFTPAEGPRRSGGEDRPERGDRPARPVGDRAPREERGPRDGGEFGGRRGGFDDRRSADRPVRPEHVERPERSGMPFAEFGDDEAPPPRGGRPTGTPEVGKLESIDNLLGDDEPGERRRGPRRPRR